jgi:hypothetical protein
LLVSKVAGMVEAALRALEARDQAGCLEVAASAQAATRFDIAVPGWIRITGELREFDESPSTG